MKSTRLVSSRGCWPPRNSRRRDAASYPITAIASWACHIPSTQHAWGLCVRNQAYILSEHTLDPNGWNAYEYEEIGWRYHTRQLERFCSDPLALVGGAPADAEDSSLRLLVSRVTMESSNSLIRASVSVTYFSCERVD